MILQTGTLLQIGKYRIERMLGQGGFGITYLATTTATGEEVAIKEFYLKDYCSRDETTNKVFTHVDQNMMDRFKRKFLKEASILKSFNHKNIVEVFDYFEDNGTAYYVMEYIEGRSLNEILKEQGHLSESTAITYIRKVAEALKYVHGRSINHLDVKPSNILLRDSDKEIFLIDFGTAKHYDVETGGATTMTQAGYSLGFAPIEQYKQGGVSIFSPETDIYSLGATLYKLITGATPPEPSVILESGLPALPSYVSQNTKKAITAAMQTSKQNRPHNLNDFITILDGNESTLVYDEETKVQPKQHYTPTNTQFSQSNESNGGSSVAIWALVGIIVIIGVLWGISSNSNSSQTYQEQVVATTTENTTNQPTAVASVPKPVKTVDSFVSNISGSARILGRNKDNTKVYYMKGSINNYTLYVYNANTEKTKIIPYENVTEDFYLYIYRVSDTKVVNHHLYVISETGAGGSGEEYSVFYIDMNDDEVYYFDSGDNVRFTNNGKVSLTKKIVTNYNTATCAADYEYERYNEVKTLR